MTVASAGFFAVAEEFFFARVRAGILVARGFAVSARLEFQTASGGAAFLDFSMKGFGRGPLPAAI
jgi:hypothetical protein